MNENFEKLSAIRETNTFFFILNLSSDVKKLQGYLLQANKMNKSKTIIEFKK